MSPDLADLLPSWLRTLRAERKSPSTLRSYETGVRAYLAWVAANDLEAVLSRRQVTAFTEALLADGVAPTTARSRQQAVRRFSAWLVEENELDTARPAPTGSREVRESHLDHASLRTQPVPVYPSEVPHPDADRPADVAAPPAVGPPPSLQAAVVPDAPNQHLDQASVGIPRRVP